MQDDSGPIRPDELDAFFAPSARMVANDGCTALAVSGGSDSMGLMVLFADWLRQSARNLSAHVVLTVDHGLRPEAAAEAEQVADQARAIGFQHAIFAWDGAKPRTGVQAAARDARYRLMADFLRLHGIVLLMTAHTREDQAETFLMRLARGSGIDGLAGIAPLSQLEAPFDPGAEPLFLARPLLDVPKARLRATLAARGIGWIEDPSNQSPAFERPRLRQARDQLEALGLTADRIALSAHRLQRAREALEAAVKAFSDPAAANVHVDPLGYVRIDRAAFRAASEEIAVRVLMRAVADVGGAQVPVPMARLEAFVALLRSAPEADGGWTLARATIVAKGAHIVVAREADREPLPELTLAPGAGALWDGRFWVAAAATALDAPLSVRALGAYGVAALRRRVAVPSAVPAGALATLPSFWRGDTLIAVPSLGYCEDGEAVVSATFRALQLR